MEPDHKDMNSHGSDSRLELEQKVREYQKMQERFEKVEEGVENILDQQEFNEGLTVTIFK